MKFSFIDAEKATIPVAALCTAVGVSRPAYYAARGRSPSLDSQETARLKVLVREIHERAAGPTARHACTPKLLARGIRVGKKRVRG